MMLGAMTKDKATPVATSFNYWLEDERSRVA